MRMRNGGQLLWQWLQHQTGQGLVEYVLILSLVALVVIGILTILGPQIGDVFSRLLESGYCGDCICGTSICVTPTPGP